MPEVLDAFFEAGYKAEPFPGGSRAATLAWASGVWQRQADRMPVPRRVEVPRPSPVKRKPR